MTIALSPVAAASAVEQTTGPELVKNGTFANGVTGWKSGSASQTLVPRSGKRGAYGSVWAAKGGSLKVSDSKRTVASGDSGVTYQASAQVRTQRGSLSGRLRVREVVGSTVVSHGSSFHLSDAKWTNVTFTFTTTKSNAALDFSVVASGASPYQPLQVDDLSLKVVSSAASTVAEADAEAEAEAVTEASAGQTCQQTTLSGTDFGVALDIPGGKVLTEAWAYAKSSYGTPEVVRIFHPGAPPNWTAATVAKGADLVVSFKIAPKDVLSGKYDSKLRSWFQSAPTDVEIYWSYFHEPEDNITKGEFTAKDYREAWKRIVSISREECQPNLHATLILMDWTVDSRSGRTFSDYYPGSAYIDVLGWDPYNPWQYNDTYVSPSSIFDKVVATSKAAGKPFGIAETGSLLMGGDKGAGRAAWLKSTASYLSGKGSLFVTYFDTVCSEGDFRLKDSLSKAAWKAVVGG
ncbi:MAG: carbohydrate binding domain-containing protein [Microbacterium sp.]|uniref:carbohydrate binding domain-containing protein n=1 Tax=Microbacterium sp. TaxID=51671 RepID=UPI0039E5D03A